MRFAVKPLEWPISRSRPSSPYRPRMIAPTVSSSLPGRQPMTTASIVRTRLTFTMPLRSPGRYGQASSLAITPSSSCSHCAAADAEYTTGVSSIPSIVSSTARRSL